VFALKTLSLSDLRLVRVTRSGFNGFYGFGLTRNVSHGALENFARVDGRKKKKKTEIAYRKSPPPIHCRFPKTRQEKTSAEIKTQTSIRNIFRYLPPRSLWIFVAVCSTCDWRQRGNLYRTVTSVRLKNRFHFFALG